MFTSFVSLGEPLMSWEFVYVACSFVVALLIWAESRLLMGNGGKLLSTRIFAIISMTTTIWPVVSALALFFLDFGQLAICVPVVYGIYTVMTWVRSAKIVGKSGVSDPMDLVLPYDYLVFCQSFALMFGLLNAVILGLSLTGAGIL